MSEVYRVLRLVVLDHDNSLYREVRSCLDKVQDVQWMMPEEVADGRRTLRYRIRGGRSNEEVLDEVMERLGDDLGKRAEARLAVCADRLDPHGMWVESAL